MSAKVKQSVSLIIGGDYHDIDFVRHELLGLLLQRPNLRTRVFEDFTDIDNICAADHLLSYTCNRVPSPQSVPKLETVLRAGGRWLALHGTNSLLALNDNRRWHTPKGAEDYFKLLGSQFAAHPPIAPYEVNVVDADHPVSRGLQNFVVEGGDELYYMHTGDDIRVLMDAPTQGPARGFVERDWDPQGRHPVLYEKSVGDGAILYFTLGHRRGHWDMQPLIDYYETEEHGAWGLPIFKDIMSRSLDWLANEEVQS